MNDPEFQFSDGEKFDCIEQAKQHQKELMDNCKDFSVFIDGNEVRFTQIGGSNVPSKSG
jgi:hypothetical protein